jgi:hypothetical protein
MPDALGAVQLVSLVTSTIKNVRDLLKAATDDDVKQGLREVLDSLDDLKQRASELTDENRELRDKLRLRGEDFEFRQPFYYEKSKPHTPLCPKCYVNHERVAPMSVSMQTDSAVFRRCLACETVVTERAIHRMPEFGGGGSDWD